MKESNLSSDGKRVILKDFNHRLNNDLQSVLAFIKLQKRFEIDDDEIINFSCVSIASISLIQNMMYYSNRNDKLISANEFFADFIKILNDNYSKYNINFSEYIEKDSFIYPKKMFQLMFLINNMINLSIDFSFKQKDEKEIRFSLENNGENSLLVYSDNGFGIKETISESNKRTLLFEQLLKQIDGTLESSDSNSIICIRFDSK